MLVAFNVTELITGACAFDMKLINAHKIKSCKYFFMVEILFDCTTRPSRF
jgi:hypothetical protein